MRVTLGCLTVAFALLVASIVVDSWSVSEVEYPGRQITADFVFGLQRVYVDYTLQGNQVSRQFVYDEFCSRNEFYSKKDECDQLNKGANATFCLILVATIGTAIAAIVTAVNIYIRAQVFSLSLSLVMTVFLVNIAATVVWATVADNAIEELTTDLSLSFLFALITIPIYMLALIRLGAAIKKSKEFHEISPDDAMINTYSEF
eukprot:TRINITY_DN6945_c0_g1_i1.p1 TRINITY_DN6945_c0_g1~~TRINITY_DN6945_c0_g1_i1.p1  ORF type:complete len:203 (-),score=55.96 TRINITY_DN6945_c0_g1_i1:296-904(-)